MSPGDAAASLPGTAASVTVTTWNSRSLTCAHAFLARMKEKSVSTLALKSDVLALQEVHNDATSMDVTAKRFATTHVACCSPAPNSCSAGLIVLMSRRFLHAVGARLDEISSVEMASGRILAVDIAAGDGASTAGRRRDLKTLFDARSQSTLRESGGISLIIVAGDHNVQSPATLTSRVGMDGSAREKHRATDGERWSSSFTSLTEVATEALTRYSIGLTLRRHRHSPRFLRNRVVRSHVSTRMCVARSHVR